MRACGDNGKEGGGKEEQLTQRLTDGADDEEQSEQTGSDVVDTNRKGKKTLEDTLKAEFLSISFFFKKEEERRKRRRNFPRVKNSRGRRRENFSRLVKAIDHSKPLYIKNSVIL